MVESKNISENNQTVRAAMLGEKKSFGKKLVDIIKEYWYLALAFGIAATIMYLIYLSMEIHPFGEGSVLVLDLNGQYVSFYEGLRNFIYGDMSLLYSFARALGGEFMGMYAYYLASPFSYIVALFPQSMILEALLTIFLLKTGFCAFTFGFYLHKTTKNNKGFSKVNVIVFSILYALSAYCVVQQHNSMWIDAVMWLPIITYGIEELIKKGHYKLYIISLAISIMSNFYIGWMTCIYCAIYFFAYYFMHNENNRNNPYREKTHFAKTFLRMVLYSAIAVAISAVIILTAYYSLTFGKTSFSNTNWTFKMRFELLDMLVKFLPSSYDTVRPEGLPFVYCGVLTLILIPVYFCSSRIPMREKILSGVLVATFLLSFVISPVDLVWHGFQKPNWLNYRYSFMLCFILLTIAHKGLLNIKRTSVRTLVFSSGILILFAGIAQKLDLKTMVLGDGSNDRHHVVGKLLTLECIWLTILCAVAYLMLLCIMRRIKKPQSISLILAVVVSLEVFCNGLVNCLDLGSDVVYTSYTTYHKTMDPLRATTSVIKDSDKSFYRLEEIYHRKVNDNMALNVHGLTSSTSTLNATTINFLQKMGYLGKSHESRYYAGNIVGDSLLGIKYVLASDANTSPEERNDKALLSDELYYSDYFSDENYTAYRNLYALSLAYAVNSDIANVDMGNYMNPYDRINAIITAMLGSEELIEVYKPLNDYTVNYTNVSVSERTPTSTSNYKFPFTNYEKSDSERTASVKFSLVIPYIDTDTSGTAYTVESDEYDDDYSDEEDESTNIKPAYQYIYFFLPSEFQRAFTFVTPAGSYGEVFGGESMRSLFVGKFNEGTNITVSLTLESTNLYVTKDVPLFYYLDSDVYLDVINKLSENQLKIDEDFKDDHFTGTISTTGEKSTVFTTIPFDEGWKVKVDGKTVDIFGALPDSSFDDKNATEGAVIAFNIDTEGDHTIEFKYRPKAFVIGAALSVIGVALLVLLIIFEKPINRVAENILFPLTIPVRYFDDEESIAAKETPQLEKPSENHLEYNAENSGDLELAEPLSADMLESATPVTLADPIDDVKNTNEENNMDTEESEDK